MRRRRLLVILSAFLAAILLLAATSPWWLGAAAHLLPDRLGLKYGKYEKIGYTRFALHNAVYQRGSVRVSSSRLEADTPILWLWEMARGAPRRVVADRWQVEILPQPTAVSKPPASQSGGWSPLHNTLRRVATYLDRWLPDAVVGPGTVRWPTGEVSLTAATWQNRVLTTKSLAYKTMRVNGTLELPAATDDLNINLQLVDSEDGDRVNLKSSGAQVMGDLTWWKQKATLSARFAERGWMPAQASLRAEKWDIPADKLKLAAAYSRVRGDAQIDWSEKLARLELAAHGEPQNGKKAPPLDVQVRGRGDLQVFTVEVLRATIPGISAVLTDQVSVERSGRIREGTASFRLEADLAQQPWIVARGLVGGEARIVSRGVKSPAIDFKLEARDVASEGVAVSAITVAGLFEWPQVTLSKAVIVGAEGEQLDLSGGWNFKTEEVRDAVMHGTLRRQTFARWLPPQPQFQVATVQGKANGPIASLAHSGEASVTDLTFTGVNPLNLTVGWEGRAVAMDKISIDARAGLTQLTLSGSTDRNSLRLTEFKLMQGDSLKLQPGRSATFHWRPSLHVEALQLAGPDATVDADIVWGSTGKAAISVRNVQSTWLKDLIALPGPAWEISSLGLTGSWDKGPMKFSGVLGGAIALGQGRQARVNLAVRGDRNGMQLEALRASEANDTIVNATGIFPMILTPGSTPFIAIDPDGALGIEAETAPNAVFWQELANLTGFELKSPRIAAHVQGTWGKPEGKVNFDAERVAFDPKRFARPLPTVESIKVALVGAHDGLQLETFSFRVEGQAVQATGRLPVAGDGWSKLFKEPLAFVRRGGDLRLEIPDADISAFSRVLPSILAPKGRIHVDVNYRAGALDGNLRLSDASTRPLGPLGVLQEIEADVRLAGQAIELRTVKARSGGEEVQLTGRIELPALNLAGTATAAGDLQPRYNVSLKGSNLPFVRRTGLLVRGDLDIKLTTLQGEERVSGTVRLRDSLFLQDVRGLLPSGAQSKARRPPYFSLDNAPMNAWRLDINLEGDQFIRVRTPVFNGVASARFRLGGTLEDPIAVGDVTINDGRVRLPFATFDVQGGRVNLTTEQPFEPQIWVTGTARRFGYDLRMELSGPATAPVLTFSSSPPLEHGQVLLMVMAGESPKQEVTFSDQQRAAQLGTFLGQSLLATFGGDSDNADRLSISSGEKVSQRGRETYDIEYRLNDRWSVTGEYDEFDEYNAGVKWRAYSREGKPVEKSKDAEGR